MNKLNLQMAKKYKEWLSELDNVEPNFRASGQYSVPYYATVDDNWKPKENGVLFVGEEGAGISHIGDWGNIETRSEWMNSYIRSNLKIEPGEFNRSPFWKAIRLFREALGDNYSYSWTNLDIIHRLNKSGNCKLSEDDRDKLHSTKTKVLQEACKIMQPKYVIFLGWYGKALKVELSEVFFKLYPNGDINDQSKFKPNGKGSAPVIVTIEEEGITYIFMYHPNYVLRRRLDHIEKVVEFLKMSNR